MSKLSKIVRCHALANEIKEHLEKAKFALAAECANELRKLTVELNEQQRER